MTQQQHRADALEGPAGNGTADLIRLREELGTDRPVIMGDEPGARLTAEWAGLVLRELRSTDAGKQRVGAAIAKVAARELGGVEISATSARRGV